MTSRRTQAPLNRHCHIDSQRHRHRHRHNGADTQAGRCTKTERQTHAHRRVNHRHPEDDKWTTLGAALAS
eukprot:8977738-Alexandrium_andersonii.AAC.1